MCSLSLTLAVAGVFTRLSPERPCRRHLRVAKRTGGLQTGRYRELQRHGSPSLDHAIVLGIIDGRALAADATAVEHLHELRLDEIGAVDRAKALHDARDTLGIDVGQKTSESQRHVVFR